MLIESPPTWSARALPTGDPDWDRMQQQLVDIIAIAVPQAVAHHAEPLINDAYNAWPVQSGESREGLSLTYEQTPSTFSAVFDGDAPYTNDIHGGRTVAELIVEPMEAATARIIADLARIIGKAA